MSDLQDALDRYDKHPGLSLADDPDLFVDAARRVANPDYEAAARLGVVWDELTKKEQVTRIAYVKPHIDTALALGITEDT